MSLSDVDDGLFWSEITLDSEVTVDKIGSVNLIYLDLRLHLIDQIKTRIHGVCGFHVDYSRYLLTISNISHHAHYPSTTATQHRLEHRRLEYFSQHSVSRSCLQQVSEYSLDDWSMHVLWIVLRRTDQYRSWTTTSSKNLILVGWFLVTSLAKFYAQAHRRFLNLES